MNGDVVGRHQVNRHHIFYPNRLYEPGAEQRFRSLGGLILPLHIPEHNTLHQRVDPPQKPSRQLREQIEEFACGVYESDVYAEFEKIAHFIGDIANSSWSDERATEAYHLHGNLVAQSGYILKGQVEEVWSET